MNKVRMVVLVIAMLAVMLVAAAPAALALEGEEIAVTGVVSYQGMKADGTLLYGITDESSITGLAPPKSYYLEGDYSAYVDQRVTVHGLLETYPERVLEVSWIE